MYQWVSMYNRLRIGLFFGGEAVEHEVSIISALQAYNAINQEKYVVVPVYTAPQLSCTLVALYVWFKSE